MAPVSVTLRPLANTTKQNVVWLILPHYVTRLNWRWQTRSTSYFTTIVVLYAMVDAHCDKLATDERGQFFTLSVQLTTLVTVDKQSRNLNSKVQSLGQSSRKKYPYFEYTLILA